ncbi:hypothetical protein L227DRAFT_586497 [Lentinus tigrinus ALCF2SS1-6]|uniref:Aspartic peptidase DDI1-type domain-containing protein n=1 Tax=Lentinus tigrinus ALCF2SS1-6 TaxID=1328759 RepID=A0A5C2S8M7_9APHY|nr:hypothetical protein L227DRAFT_586497 [Lentinus tigrinus ALCF2SS1-6]
MGDALEWGTASWLNTEFPWPIHAQPEDVELARFSTFRYGQNVLIEDAYLALGCSVDVRDLENPKFDLLNWYARCARRTLAGPAFELDVLDDEIEVLFEHRGAREAALLVSAAAVKQPTLTIQRNAATLRDFRRVVPDPVVVIVYVNGHPSRALLDSGSQADFISGRLAHQLRIKAKELEKPLPVQLAVQGSRSKVNYGCKVRFQYQDINEERYFDVLSVPNYDVILGTPFLNQHEVALGFNPVKVAIGSDRVVPFRGIQTRVIESRAADLFEDRLEAARQELRAYAAPICREASDAPFPPLRAINHTIPLKDPAKVYTWRPSRCLDAHRANWIEKKEAYFKSGCVRADPGGSLACGPDSDGNAGRKHG